MIVDINMPQMDGFTFLKTLRKQTAPISSMPALVISTEAGPQDIDCGTRGRRQLLPRQAGPPGDACRACHDHVRAGRMNEFVEQFLIEGRELVTQGNDDLLALEEHPDDKERLDGAFRALHTLKGAAGIVDFVAMGRAMHAAEDGLAAVRSSAAAVTPPLIDLCLACLDQVSVWIDQMQITGEIPADADAKADDLVLRFASLGASDKSSILPKRDPLTAPPASVGLSPIARQLLEAQKLLLAEPAAEGAAGRLESAGRVSANVLRHQGRSLDANDLEGLLQSSLLAGDAMSMAAAIDRVLEGLSEPAPSPPGRFPLDRPMSLYASTSTGSTRSSG